MNFEDTSSTGRMFVSYVSERRYDYNNFRLNNIHLLNLLFFLFHHKLHYSIVFLIKYVSFWDFLPTLILA